ncbi:sigma-70 family RNA polymerase sigma factor [Actinokineospora auranticolor]|uniref:RNA polymerase sigma-70 factor (ECF subfamily) n=1 Tax=Actinokineospora auranticolor TaxID=155976 RepID=A0A2S6GKD7_9PSEU|nr:sigma-70 family RNA polymerase sigma factor [Actinokineospora auranticolor]PPK65621.1 RNA polymerase sigma-70 factor (ECF subfamily) [Actinokineospora auranticolor]
MGRRLPARRGPGGSDGGRARLRVVSAEPYPDWESVYRDNVDRVFRLIFSRVGNRADAEDLTGEVFLRALRPLRLSASVGEVRTYLVATSRTVLAEHWRRTLGREITTFDDERDVAEAVPDLVDARAGERAERILAALPERYALVLRLRFLQGCSLKEVAARLGVTVANAKVLQHRAVRRAGEVAGGVET